MSAPVERTPRMREIDGVPSLNPAGLARWLYGMDEDDGREMSATKPEIWALIVILQQKVRARLIIEPNLDDAIAAVVNLERVRQEIRQHGAGAATVMLRRVCGGGAS